MIYEMIYVNYVLLFFDLLSVIFLVTSVISFLSRRRNSWAKNW